MNLPIKSRTDSESYHFSLGNRYFAVHYSVTSMDPLDGGDKRQVLDDHVNLVEILTNHYETPLQRDASLSAKQLDGSSKVRKTKEEIIRSVDRAMNEDERLTAYFVEIQQWRDIPSGLDALLDTLPDHVKNILRMEYDDPNATPYDFYFQGK